MIDEQKEILIQKCVDGELDVETQQRLLAQLDVLTEGWKVLALAYVEEQTWTRSFSENNRIAQHLENRAFGTQMSTQSASSMEPQEVQCFMPPTTVDPERRSRLLTQATCLAIALVGGVLIGDIWRSRQGSPNMDIAKNAKTDTTGNAGGNLSSDSGALAVGVPGQNGDTMRLSAYPPDQFTNREIPELRFPAEFTDILRQAGLRLDQDQKWISLELEDGRRALMPVDSWNVRPVGQ